MSKITDVTRPYAPEEYRSLFAVSEHTIYLNHAATSPLSRRVIAGVEEHLRERHDTLPENWEIVLERCEKLRALLAQLIGSTPDRIALLQNTSAGLNVIANGLDWQAGDEILIPEGEFPANVCPFLNLERHGVTVKFVEVPEGGLTPEILENAIGPRTRLLTLSFVEFLSGYKADLEAIGAVCKAHDIIFIVDGIQGVGAIPIDVDKCGIDALANGMHKWLMCPQGLGFLYLSEAFQEKVYPNAVGWVGLSNPEDFLNYRQELSPGARRYELGGLNSAAVAGSVAAVATLLEVGPANIYVHLKRLTQRLIDALDAIGFPIYGSRSIEHRSGIVTFYPGDKRRSAALVDLLTENRISVSLRAEMIRVAPHFYNTPEEIDTLLAVCREFR